MATRLNRAPRVQPAQPPTPLSTSSASPSLRALENSLAIAKNLGFKIPDPTPIDPAFAEPDLPAELMDLMREILDIQAREIQLSASLSQAQDYLENWDVASVESIDRRTKLLLHLSDHFELATSSAPLLAARLQKTTPASKGFGGVRSLAGRGDEEDGLLVEPAAQ
ncbi:hypothetical protein HDU93_005773, partial [Gonapodya sp. JEL0774]